MSCAERPRGARAFPLALRAARTPDAPALLWSGAGPRAIAALTFCELDAWTRDVAGALAARGIARGERVGVLLAPGPLFPALLLALLRAGAVAVPLSTRVPPAALPGLLARAGCTRLVASPAVAAAGVEVLSPAAIAPAGPSGGCGNAPPAPFDPRADATIVFTSGSTGVPKAALHAFESHWASAVGANRTLPLRRGDRWLLSLPLWHVGGLAVVFRCLQAGAAVAVPRRDEPLAGAALRLGATHLSLVATQLLRLLREPAGRAALRAARVVLLGGGPLPAPLIDEAARAGVPIAASYGCTETASLATATRLGAPEQALRTAGRALPFRQIAVGGGGEILARGRTLFRGYVEGDRLEPARDVDGWYRTGDLGHSDAAGRLVVEGRRDAMFVSGGENIHPEAIERALCLVPGVLEALVVPVPDPEFGARPAAFVRSEGPGAPDPETIGRALRQRLPGFMIPVRYLPWPDLAGLKPDRRALAELASRRS